MGIRDWARRLREEVRTLYLAGRDPRTPWVARLLVVCVVAYALSPIDLIPDFIPVLGLLDDVILVPLGIALALRLLPREVWQDAKAKAAAAAPPPSRIRTVAAGTILLLWLAAIAAVVYFIAV